ncbi:hypothetical protein [uncultured Nostoc sp.]|uniref:hypothetical protein n=1 Tax=uncultured Nostoc sp. TaxID=340711 RepID=UPI0035CA4D22
MIHPTNSDKTQLDALISHGMSHRQTNNNFAESDKESAIELFAETAAIAGADCINSWLDFNSFFSLGNFPIRRQDICL